MKSKQFDRNGHTVGHPQHGFGFKPDPGRHGINGFYAGFHQHPAARFGTDLPPIAGLAPFAPPVWDQFVTSSCTGHAKACVDTTTLAAHGKPLPTPESPRWEYAIGRAVDRSDPHQPLQDIGAAPNSLVRGSSVWGVLVESEADRGFTAESSDYGPHLTARINDEPKLDELVRAARRIITGYNAILDVDSNKWPQIKQALASKHAVQVAVDGGSPEFQNYDERSGPLGFTGSDPDHMIAIIDYATVGALKANGIYPNLWPIDLLPDTAELALIQNSWGVWSWTASGRAWVTVDFVKRGCFNTLIANLGA